MSAETRKASWLDHPMVGGPSWARAIGALVVVDLALLVATGALLMTVYAPAPQTAWASVEFLHHAIAGGSIVRGLHRASSDALILLAGAHVAWILVTGLYKRPLRGWYWLALVLVALAMAGAITGHLLPFDQKGYWARKVELNILGMAPGIGAWLQRFLQGGADLGALGLTRAYAAHVVLIPLLAFGVIAARARILRDAAPADGLPYRRQLARDLVAATALIAVLFVVALATRGGPLDAPADPLSDYPARPEWFLLPMYELRKFFKGGGEFWGTVGIPTMVGVYVAAIPLMDRTNGSLKARAPTLALPAAFVVALGALAGAAAKHDANDAEYKKARAKADTLAQIADRASLEGVPPTGPLDMPDLRGYQLFEKSCASCHVLGDLGDPKKADAPRLDGWGTVPWLLAMMHDPDAPQFFGKTPYKGTMPSVDAPKEGEAMLPDKNDQEAVAIFLASLGDEQGDPPRHPAKHERGERLFIQKCETCHTYKGEGDIEGSGTAPNMDRYGSVAWTRAQIANPSSKETYRDQAVDTPESKGHMPAFADDLPASDIDLLARWVRKTARSTSP